MDVHLYTGFGDSSGKSFSAFATLACLLEHKNGKAALPNVSQVVVFDANRNNPDLYRAWLKPLNDTNREFPLDISIDTQRTIKLRWYTIADKVCVISPDPTSLPSATYSDEMLFLVVNALLNYEQPLGKIIPKDASHCLIDTADALHTIVARNLPDNLLMDKQLYIWLLWTVNAIQSQEDIESTLRATGAIKEATKHRFSDGTHLIHVFNPQFREGRLTFSNLAKLGKQIVDRSKDTLNTMKIVDTFSAYFNVADISCGPMTLTEFQKQVNLYLVERIGNPGLTKAKNLKEKYELLGQILLEQFPGNRKRYTNVFAIPGYDLMLSDFKTVDQLREIFFAELHSLAVREKHHPIFELHAGTRKLGWYYKKYLSELLYHKGQ